MSSRIQVEIGLIDNLSKEIAKISASVKKSVGQDIPAAVDKSKASISGLQGGLGALQGAFAAAGIGVFLKSIASAGLAMDGMERSLKAATGSSEAAAAEMAFVRSESNRLGLSLQETGGEYAKLAAAARGTTLQGQATRDIFTAVSEASVVLGLSADSASGALNAIQQMISKGTVQAEELRGQLGERLPGAFQMAARAMGKTTQELGKMLEQGQVTADDFLPKLAAEMKKTFGDQVPEAMTSAQAEFNRFKTTMFELQADLARNGVLDFLVGIAKAAAFVAQMLSGVFKTVAAGLDSVLAALIDTLRDFVGMVEMVLSALPDRLVPDGWVKSLKDAQHTLSLVSKDFRDHGDALASGAMKNFGAMFGNTGTDAVPAAIKSGTKTNKSASPIDKKALQEAQKLDDELDAQEIAFWNEQRSILEEELQWKHELKATMAQLEIDMQAEGQAKELAIIQNKMELERQAIMESDAWKVANTQERETILTAISEKGARERAETEKKYNTERREAAFTVAGNLIQAGKTVLEGNKEFAIALKALAIGEIIINTSRAIMATLAQGGVFATPVAISMGVLGAAQVAKVAAQKFENGGPVFGASHSGGGVNANLEGGEFVLSKRDVNRMGGAQGVENLRRGGAISVVVNASPIYVNGSAPSSDVIQAIQEASDEAAYRVAKEVKRAQELALLPG